jgi:hypothetical protein
MRSSGSSVSAPRGGIPKGAEPSPRSGSPILTVRGTREGMPVDKPDRTVFDTVGAATARQSDTQIGNSTPSISVNFIRIAMTVRITDSHVNMTFGILIDVSIAQRPY